MFSYRFLIAAILWQVAIISPVLAEKRVALVVGNSAYTQAGQLPNPVNDAADMAKALTKLGFDVILGLDLDHHPFEAKVRDFSHALNDADVGVLFYSGHGLQVGGRNYLIPVDATLGSERDLDFEAIQLDFILRQMEVGREGKTNIVFLDACRNNPLARNLAKSMGTRSPSVSAGLAEVQTGVGTFIAFSTQPGNVALDGTGKNSPFTGALAKHLQEAGRNLTAIMIGVRNDVLAETAGHQVPWDHSALTKDFFFQPVVSVGNEKSSPSGDAEAIRLRLLLLEEELKKKSDRQQTLNLVTLSQLQERVRQIDVAIRDDQQRIFDVYNKHGQEGSSSRNTVSMEIGSIQLQMARRGQERKALEEQISKLEAALGSGDASK